MIGYILEIRTGYGFISTDDGKEFFFHNKSLTNCNIRQLQEGDRVEFDIGQGDGQRRDPAINVRKMDQAEPIANLANPGINPNVIFDHFNSDERRIIKSFGKVFYVTSGGGEVKVGNSQYRYFLVKPTEYFVSTFNLNRELVVVFVDYVSFEPRSLDAAFEVYKTINSQLRLDRGCSIIVCHDDAVEEKLTRWLKDNNVSQIVVPFTYRELLENGDISNTVTSRFRKYLFDRDLFAESKPIESEVFFFGRRDLVHDIVSKCKSNTHCGVFGLRRSGKTSVLYAVQNLLRQQNYPTVFIPCESDLSSLDWRSALCSLVHSVYKALGRNESRIQDIQYVIGDTWMFFESDMDAAFRGMSLPTTIMFDEIEAITFGVNQGEDSPNLWMDGVNFYHFWSSLKGYVNKNQHSISILIAGTNPMINEVHFIDRIGKQNPMFRTLTGANQGEYLPSFGQDDTRNMINTLGGYMGVGFDEYCIGRITSNCGGHPYLTRVLCSHINRFIRDNGLSRPITITKAIYDKAASEFWKSSEADSFFMMILNILLVSYPREFETLKVLALQGDGIVSRIQERDSLHHLLGYGLVEINQGNYAIRFDAISDYLRGEFRFERTDLTIKQQKEEINLRINDAEIQLRKLVKNTLLTTQGAEKAKRIVINAMQSHTAITQQDISKAQQMTYNQMFDASVNKVYFSLLQYIIIQNYNLFGYVFEGYDLAIVKAHLKVINEARRCPDHSFSEDAANWSWDKFAEFRKSITWLESVLKSFD